MPTIGSARSRPAATSSALTTTDSETKPSTRAWFPSATFGGVGRLAAWGTTDATEARRLLDICLDAGVTMFDTADVYSLGESERVLGEAIKGRRDKVLISTKATFRFGDGPNDVGSSRQHLLAAIDAFAEPARHRLHRPVPASWLRCA